MKKRLFINQISKSISCLFAIFRTWDTFLDNSYFDALRGASKDLA